MLSHPKKVVYSFHFLQVIDCAVLSLQVLFLGELLCVLIPCFKYFSLKRKNKSILNSTDIQVVHMGEEQIDKPWLPRYEYRNNYTQNPHRIMKDHSYLWFALGCSTVFVSLPNRGINTLSLLPWVPSILFLLSTSFITIPNLKNSPDLKTRMFFFGESYRSNSHTLGVTKWGTFAESMNKSLHFRNICSA